MEKRVVHNDFHQWICFQIDLGLQSWMCPCFAQSLWAGHFANRVSVERVASPVIMNAEHGVIEVECETSPGNTSLVAKHMRPVVQSSMATFGLGRPVETQSAVLEAVQSANQSCQRSDSERTLVLGESPGPRRTPAPLMFKPSLTLEKFIPQALPVPWFGHSFDVPWFDVVSAPGLCSRLCHLWKLVLCRKNRPSTEVWLRRLLLKHHLPTFIC